MTPARILHLLAGSPALDGAAPLDAPAPCWVCARPSATDAFPQTRALS